jgi:hypothetical protein
MTSPSGSASNLPPNRLVQYRYFCRFWRPLYSLLGSDCVGAGGYDRCTLIGEQRGLQCTWQDPPAPGKSIMWRMRNELWQAHPYWWTTRTTAYMARSTCTRQVSSVAHAQWDVTGAPLLVNNEDYSVHGKIHLHQVSLEWGACAIRCDRPTHFGEQSGVPVHGKIHLHQASLECGACAMRCDRRTLIGERGL